MGEAPKDCPPLLQVSALRVFLGQPRVEVVREIGFSIRKGEILALAGESGSGKSVTAMTLTRLLPATARPRTTGEVTLTGVERNLLRLPERELRRIRGRRIGYIFQEPSTSFNPLFTIGSHLREVLRRNRPDQSDPEAAIREALESVGIPSDRTHLQAWPGQFSGGMLQRVAIACALLGQPDLLVADEPTTALDTTSQRRIVELLARLNREHGMAILFISHDLGLLKEIASRILVMRAGSLVEEGVAEKILHSPQHPYTQQLVEAAPKLRL